MRRVGASIKIGRRGKGNNETKGIQGGGAPRGAGLRPGQVSPGQESPVPEKQELHQSSWAERGSQGVKARPQESGDVLRLPGTLTDTCAPGRAPHPVAELPKGLQHLPGGALGAAPRQLGWRLHAERPERPGVKPTAQAQEPRAPGTQPKIRRSPETRRDQEGAGQQGHSCCQAARS